MKKVFLLTVLGTIEDVQSEMDRQSAEYQKLYK